MKQIKFFSYMLKSIIFILTFMIFVGIFAGQSQLKVVTSVPASATFNSDSVREIVFTFNKPFTRLSEVKDLEIEYKCNPFIKGRFRARGTDVLVFIPETPFRPDKEYTFTLSKGLLAPDSSTLDSDYSVIIKPVRLFVRYTDLNYEHVPVEHTFSVFFNYPVNPTAKGFITISSGNKQIPVTVTPLKDSNGYAASVSFKGLEKLRSYTLRINNPELMQTPYTYSFRTINELRFIENKNVPDINYEEETSFYLEFTAPVKPSELRGNVQLYDEDKEIPINFSYYYGNNAADIFYVDAMFKPRHEYKLVIGKAIKDITGSSIINPGEYKLTTLDYRSFVNFSGGYMYPNDKLTVYIETMNYGYFDILTKFLDTSGYIAFINTMYENNYDWYNILSAKYNPSRSFKLKKFKSNAERNKLGIFDINLNKEFNDNSWLGMGILEYKYSEYDTARVEFFFQKSSTKITGIFSNRNGYLLMDDRNTHKPSESGKLLLLNSKGSTVNRYAFKNGRYSFSTSEMSLLDKHASKHPAYLLALTGSGQAILPFFYSRSEPDIKLMAFPDRDLCRLNDSINVSGLLRYKNANIVECASNVKLDYEIFNPVSKKVYSGSLKTDKLGAFSQRIMIPDSFVTGYYYIYYRMNGDYAGSAYFNVEEFREPEYKVSVKPDSLRFHSGRAITAAVSAEYLTGEAMMNDSVHYQIIAYRNSFYSDKYQSFNFYISDDTSYIPNPIIEERSTLSSKGTCPFSSRIPEISSNPLSLSIIGTVISDKKESISSSAYAQYLPLKEYAGMKLESPDSTKNDSVKFSCIIVNTESEPLKGKKFSVLVLKSYDYYGNDRDTLAEFKMKSSSEPVSDYFLPDEDAIYTVIMKYNDREVMNTLYYQKRSSSYDMPYPMSPYIITDKSSYSIGDTVHLSVISPVRNGTLHMFFGTDSIYGLENADCTDTVHFSIPVIKDFLGGFYAGSFISTEDSMYDQSMQTYFINVNSNEMQIKTDILIDKEEYEPGDSVILTLSTDCKEANAFISVIDESVLMLTGYSQPDPFYSMYSNYNSSFSFCNSAVLPSYYNGGYKYRNGGYALDEMEATGDVDKVMTSTAETKLSAKEKMASPQAMEGNERKDIDIRQTFASSPLYRSNVSFDSKGNALIKFKLPDNATKFRITVISYSKDKFGKSERTFNVTKKLLIRSGLPNFLRPFDKFKAVFQISDNTMKEGSITSGINAKACFHTGDSMLPVKPVDNKALAEFDMEAGVADSAEFIMYALKKDYSDYMRISIPVIDKYLYEHSAVFGSSDDSVRQYMDLNMAQLKDYSSLNISLYPSQIAQTDLPLRYLEAYPYECLEQKVSRIFPYLVGEKIINTYKMGKLQGKALRKYVNAVIGQIGKFQDSNGGFKYYEDSRYTSEYLSLYVMYAAHIAKKSGYTIDKEILNKGLNYIKRIAESDFAEIWSYSKYAKYSMRCFALYVLSLYNDVSYAENVSEAYKMREYLYYSEKGRLLELLDIYHMTAEADTLYAEILSDIRVETGYAYFDDNMNDWWLFQSELKNTAVILSSILRTGREFPFAEKTVRFFSLRAKKGMWLNTHTTALVLEALHEYFLKYESEKPDFTAHARNDGKDIAVCKFRNYSDPVYNKTIKLSEMSSEALDLITEGTGRLYYVLTMKYASKGIVKPLFNGFEVERVITDMNGNKVKEFKKGEVYKITVKVKTDKSRVFVVIDDAIPAGFDIVKTGFRTEFINDKSDKYYNYWWGGFSHDEFYRDRAVAAAVYLSEGSHDYSYYVRAICAGNFSYPPVNVFEMYTPEVFGHTGSSRIIIK